MTTGAGPTPSGRRFEPDFLIELFRNPLDPGYADAAARRAVAGPRRTPGALVARSLALFVIGLLLAVAYREAVAAQPERTRAHEGLVSEVKAAQALTDGLQQQRDVLRRDVTAEQQAALGASSASLQKIREQEAATGLAPVRGPGVVVDLVDAPPPIDPTTGKAAGVEVSRVLDIDLQSVVNALWSAGAEAVAINGQRLTATATIRSAGSAVLVDFRPITSPYQVTAIGPADLDEKFDHSSAAAAMRGLVQQYGLGFGTRSAADLLLPAAAGPSLRYAQPLVSPSPSRTQQR